MRRLKRISKPRLHREGTDTLFVSFVALAFLNVLSYYFLHKISWLSVALIAGVSVGVYGVIVNFFRCPIRIFADHTENVVVAPADGKVVVVEETEENEYFRDRRLMVSIFMSVTNVHANWFPVDGTVKMVKHHDGNFHKAWLPKASTENERSTVVIETPAGQEILLRQVAGAVARRIVTYAREGDECYIDEHLGFIKFGSRVDVYLPLGTEILVKLGQAATGNQTVIARLHP